MVKDRSVLTKSLKSTRIGSPSKKSTVPFDECEHLVVIPPDGGWGWLVVAASFLCNFFVDGTMYTFGIFLDEISESFNVRVTQVAVANSIMCGFYFIVGPISCALANRFGFRVVGVIGGIIASSAFFLSTMFTDLIAFHVFIGCVCGIGFNMIFVPSLLVVGFYFDKWRALSTAIALCGSSIGVIAFPPVFTTLLKRFDWRWKFRLLSGLTGTTILCCLVYRPLRALRITGRRDDRNIEPLINIDDGDSIGSFYIDTDAEQPSIRQIFRQNFLYPTTSDLLASTRRPTGSISTFFTYNDFSDSSAGRSIFTYRPDDLSVGYITVYYEELNDKHRNWCRKYCSCFCYFCGADTDSGMVNRPMYRDDIFYVGSLSYFSDYSKSKETVVSEKKSTRKSVQAYHLAVTRVATQRDIEEQYKCVICAEAITRTIATMLNFKLLISPSFMLLTLSGFFTMLGIFCPFIFIVKRAEEMKIDKDWSVLLLTVIGISNTVGRIACGAVSCIPRCDSLVISYVTLFITGGIIIISNYISTLRGQMTFAILFGFNIASLTVLRSIVIVELMGLENLTNGFGIITMFYGIASFLGVPSAAYLRHLTGRYEASFIFSGCSFLLSALLLTPIREIAKWEANKKKPKVTFKTILFSIMWPTDSEKNANNLGKVPSR